MHLDDGSTQRFEKELKKVLYIAFHYPPALGSSGIHRTVVNTRILSQSTQCEVLTCSTAAHDHLDFSTAIRIPKRLKVIRAWARSTAKTFSIRGKYFSIMAQPDSWISWIPSAILSGIFNSVIKKPNVVISSCPIPSALIIGYVLKKLLRVPWIVDLRDPLLQVDYPVDIRKRRIFKWLESIITENASVVIITTLGTQRLYQERFPNIPSSFWQLIPNGFDEETFDLIEQNVSTLHKSAKFTLLHSGVIYPSERNPEQLFDAIRELKEDGKINSGQLKVVLRATGHDQFYQPILDRFNIADVVHLEPIIPFEEAIAEMFTANALLLLQDANCNYQIPAKVYEYIRVGKPILALTPVDGDTGQLLSELKQSTICPLDDKRLIKKALVSLLNNNDTINDKTNFKSFGRAEQAKKFSTIVEDVMKSPNKYRA